MKTLTQHLNNKKASNKLIVVPYIMAGDGGLDTLEQKLQLLEDSGVSAIEVGIPFSDPVADGPVIQQAGLRALAKGTSLEATIEALKKSRVNIPLIIMSYFNPILHFGIKKMVRELEDTPVKGLIIPDLPYEHEALITQHLAKMDIALIPLISLTSNDDRIHEITENREGFVYAVTINGTTGVRQDFNEITDEHLQKLAKNCDIPVLAGFGVSSTEHVKRFGHVCDGIIIGSKIVKMFAENRLEELQQFLTSITALSKNELK